jgi:hypothetical protein
VQAAAITIVPFLEKLSTVVLNPIIGLLFAVSFLIFVYGIANFINSETTSTKRTEGKQKIIWGLVGMLIMFSAFGIIHAIITTIPGGNTDSGFLRF